MSADNLEQMIRQADGDVVGMLRNAPVGQLRVPLPTRVHELARRAGAWARRHLFDQSTHMTDVYSRAQTSNGCSQRTAVN